MSRSHPNAIDDDYHRVTDCQGATKELVIREEKETCDIARESNITDKTAALNQIIFQLGSVLAAPLGGGLYDAIGWRHTCLITSGLSLAAAVIYTL